MKAAVFSIPTERETDSRDAERTSRSKEGHRSRSRRNKIRFPKWDEERLKSYFEPSLLVSDLRNPKDVVSNIFSCSNWGGEEDMRQWISGENAGVRSLACPQND